MELAAADVRDADEVMRVINAAYVVETGDSGYGFKSGNRMSDPLDEHFMKAYQEGRMIKVVSECNEIVGATYWRVTENDTIYFGPFAVRPDMQGRKVGKLMLAEIERLAREKNLRGIEIKVVNWRTDLIPWYESMGYQHTQSEPWPSEYDHVLLRNPTFFYSMVRPLASMTVTDGDSSSGEQGFTGGCLCGNVRYSVQSLPNFVYYCHCGKCRKISGSVVGAWLTVPANQLSITGELSTFNSSKEYFRRFCSSCGSHVLFSRSDGKAEFVEICHGTLDQPSRFPPQNHIWSSSKLTFLKLNEELPSFESEPCLMGNC
jgi:GNAT superfamily N-acetyltransferase